MVKPYKNTSQLLSLEQSHLSCAWYRAEGTVKAKKTNNQKNDQKTKLSIRQKKQNAQKKTHTQKGQTNKGIKEHKDKKCQLFK
jgi:hypothetical protein